MTTKTQNLSRCPKVTIAIPTLNREAYLRIALNSALGQTHKNVEVIISDNASSDGTQSFLSILQNRNLVILRQPTKLTMVENWNACLARATGDYFLLLSDDDVLEPTAVAEMVATFESDGDKENPCGFVYCRGRIIDEQGIVIGIGQLAPNSEKAEDIILSFFESRRDLWPCSIMYRRLDMAPYTSEFSLATDAATWIGIVARYGTAKFISNLLVSYRKHLSLTFNNPYTVWTDENARLAEFSISAMKKYSSVNRNYIASIQKAQHRLNIRVTGSFINRKGNRFATLKEYFRNFEVFHSFYGLRIFARGVLMLCLPISIKKILKRSGAFL